MRYKLNRQFSTWMRIGQIIYNGKSEIGSGLDRIEGNRKTEIKLEVTIDF
jgi:hypothetical protein